MEKVFDDIENKLGEKKAWASCEEARMIQGRFVALTYNLLVLYERRIDAAQDIHNRPEDERRAKRTSTLEEVAMAAGRAMSSLLRTGWEAAPRSVKFIRWLRSSQRDRLTEETAVVHLRRHYATL